MFTRSPLDRLWQTHAAQAGCLGERRDFRFDPHWYRARHGDATGDVARHHRRAGGPGTWYADLRREHPQIDAVLDRLAVAPELRAAFARGDPEAAELTCELIRLGDPVDRGVSEFSMQAYLKWHPDLVTAGMDPLEHYLLWGCREPWRKTLAQVRQGQVAGRRVFDAARSTVLIAVHEFERSGAPVVGLDLAREAAETHNVVAVSMKDGPLKDPFRDHTVAVAVTGTPGTDFPFFTGPAFEQIDFAILNSFATAEFTIPMVGQGIPFATYIHEYADYAYPLWGRVALTLFADLAVFPAGPVRESWRGQFIDYQADFDRDTRVLPQREVRAGGLPGTAMAEARARLSRAVGRDLSDVRLVAGAGLAQWRKGTDVFAMTATICAARDPGTVFVWIGDGLNHEDHVFGNWFDIHLRRAGANDPAGNLFFLPAGPLYPDLLAAADVFYLPSRIDPLPNVVFDALDRGAQAVVFRDATGFSDPVYRDCARITEVGYADPAAAAEAILALPRKAPGEPVAAARLPVFQPIAEMLRAQLDAVPQVAAPEAAIDLTALFSQSAAERPLRDRERARLARYGRRFAWRDENDARRALAATGNPVHARCRIAALGTAQGAAPFALHLHAYHVEPLDEVLATAAVRAARRVVVTTDTEAKAGAIATGFAAAGLRPDIRVVPNRGRDVLPFLDLFAPGADGPDDALWAHLHLKRTPEAPAVGEVWRRFLFRILLGDGAAMSSALDEIARPATGLVAAFDPHAVPWNDARRLLPSVAGAFDTPLPDPPLLFPVGNMFWCRADVASAMRGVFGEDYPWPNEPIAADGTVYHLIERLWPSVAVQCGLEAVFLSKPDQPRVPGTEAEAP